MRKLCCIVLVCVLVFVISGCGLTEGQEPVSGDVSTENPASVGAQAEDIISDTLASSGMSGSSEAGNSFDFNSKTVMLNSGYEMPIYGIGTYSLTGEVCVESVTAALDRGVRLIDTAHMYHNEESVGEAVRNSDIPREEIFVITKLYPNQYSDPEAAIEEALDKLDIEYIDARVIIGTS